MKTSQIELTRKHKKLVIVGNGMCGKTSLLCAYKDDQFAEYHSPTVFETYVTDVPVDGRTVALALYDTAGQEDYNRLRHLSYPDTDIVLICFSVDDPESARDVIEKWLPEVRYYCESCPLILVACKKDLRTDPTVIKELRRLDESPVSNTIGKRIAAEIRAAAYVECSAKTREGVQDLFIQAARLTLKSSHRRNLCSYCPLS